ncbi:acyl carrier protein [Vibrio sp. MACH09]|uniref:acyl carrier protein n=1 Tax=unclassified Vibrio TaxID=2614977 RepID=UPI0014939A0A|nr:MULTISPECIES: acyl carrier protein [unclassified Vibrio]NOI68257.1 acyl carrier protein [Vibrio sp. 99-8-1]GLO61993.1 acyl carrier protein [Vibrio sp. MACH09]
MTDVNKEQIFNQIKDALVELFEIDEADITLDAHLYQDLDLDSIDAVDLVVHLQKVTGKKIKPEEFKAVRTVSDIVESVDALLKDN